MHDLKLFGTHAWGLRDVSCTIEHVLDAWEDGAIEIETLSEAWDDAQRRDGLARATRVRRRGTLRALLVHAQASGLVSKAVTLDPLGADNAERVSVYVAAEQAIERAMETERWRDAALLCLAWENGATLRAIRALRVGDLPLACSRRCDDALRMFTSGRPDAALVFPGRASGRAIGGDTICELLRAHGLRGMVAVRHARAQLLRTRGYSAGALTTQAAARIIAGEE